VTLTAGQGPAQRLEPAQVTIDHGQVLPAAVRGAQQQGGAVIPNETNAGPASSAGSAWPPVTEG
jgi:hypothetical protein